MKLSVGIHVNQTASQSVSQSTKHQSANETVNKSITVFIEISAQPRISTQPRLSAQTPSPSHPQKINCTRVVLIIYSLAYNL